MNPQLFRYGVSNLSFWGRGQRDLQIIKSLGKGSVRGRGQRVLQIIRLNTLVDVIRVAKHSLHVNGYRLIQIL